MMEVQPNSHSLMLRATHIIVARVVSANDPTWVRGAEFEERIISLQLELEETLKGRIRQRPGETLRVEAKQLRLATAWRPLPGVWSNVPVAAGTRFVAFSRMDGDDAAAALNDPAVIQLVLVADALRDVRLAANAARRGVNLGGLLAEAIPVADSIGDLFADYLWAKYEAEAVANFAAFNLIMEFMERPALNRIARATLLMSIPSSILAPEPQLTKHIDRLAVAMFRLLALPEAATLHDNIVGTYLPNLLDAGEPTARPASVVFKGYPNEQSRASRALAAHKNHDAAAVLLNWLRH
jgi:hypothetical protein